MPESATADPPAATTTPPSAPPQGSPPQSGAAPALENEGAFSDAFADLDAIDQGKAAPPPKSRRGTPPPQPKEKKNATGAENGTEELEETGTSESPSAKSADELGKGSEAKDKQGEPGASEAGANGKPVKAKELREAYYALKDKESQEYIPEISRLRSRVAELEADPAGRDSKALQERLANVAKRNEELENHIKFVDYSQSAEYREKYQEPYVKAWDDARFELRGLKLTIANPETGEQMERDITDADLQYLGSLEPVQRRQEVRRLFPDDRDEVLRHVNNILRLAEASEHALETAKQTSGEVSKQRNQQFQQAQRLRAETWTAANRKLAERYPQFCSPKEDDPEGNKLLERGQALADLLLNPAAVKKEQVPLLPKWIADTLNANKRPSLQQITTLQATIRNKAANHDRLAFQLRTAQKELEEARATIKQYEESGPDGGRAGGRQTNGSGDYMEDAGAELDRLDKQNIGL